MKAIIQSYSGGGPEVAEVPPPALAPGGILVRTAASLVSAGTERAMVELAAKGLLGKARDRPDLVRQVIAKVRRDGVAATVETVRRRLDVPVPLGYSSAGTVVAVGEGVSGFRAGDRVACAGAGYALHAEVAFIPRLLAVALPAEVAFEAGAFTTVGAIALQGLRLSGAELGETVAVVGLGLVGLLTVALARAAGCRVVGMDPDAGRCRLAEAIGAAAATTDPAAFLARCLAATGGRGADRVLIAASTRGSEPVALAGEVARDRGAVVAVGAVGLELPRKPYFDKELAFRVSRSYGPGRYDPDYEEKGRDYPVGYVRWTENRNMEAFVALLAEGKVDVAPLISHRVPIAEAARAYALLTGGGDEEPSLGVVLLYPGEEEVVVAPAAPGTPAFHPRSAATPATTASATPSAPIALGVLGAGQFAAGVLLPALARLPGVELRGVCTASGVRAHHAAKRFGFRYATTDEAALLADPAVTAVVVATRHHLHARQVLAALRAGKDVFVEKPLCLTAEELAEIAAELAARREATGRDPLLQVGYNRRFAPMVGRLADHFAGAGEPLLLDCRVNAGYLPPEHWVHDPEQGGGRIVGEVCHFVDLLSHLAGGPPVRVAARALPDGGRYRDDNLVATLEFAGGSLATLTYAANGDSALPKERLEVLGGGRAAVLDNFRRLDLYAGGRRRTVRSWLRQDKGHRGELAAFVAASREGSPPPIPLAELLAVTRATLAIRRWHRGDTTSGAVLHEGTQ